MQRSFLARNVAVRRLLSAGFCVSCTLPSRGRLAPSTSNVPVRSALSIGQPFRCYSGGHEEEPPTRSGQYLLDKNDVLTRVLEVVKNFEKVDAAKVTPESHFVNDLGLNSLDVVEVVFAIEQEFILDIPDHDAEKLQSIPDTVEYIAQNPMAK